ncbi:MAG: YceI family protein [Pseudomonadota bacterium]
MTLSLAKRLLSSLLICLSALLLGNGSFAQGIEQSQAGTYKIVSEKSDIRLLAYRGGVLSTFGHNHVVSVSDLTGTIVLEPKLQGSRIEFVVQVNKLVVDDAEVRRQEGKEFAKQPSQSDIKGTRANMLGEQLLNAAQFPTIKVTGVSGPTSDGKSAQISITTELLGRHVKLTLPASLKIAGKQLEASGTRNLTHEELGLKPFSALMGALRVASKMKLKYRIVAEMATE